MLQIGICDDETLLLAEIKKLTDACLQQQHCFSILSTYTDGKTLLYDIHDGKHFDLLLLDIEMPDLSGMELAAQIHNLLPDALMIFVTAHYKYAVDAYALHIFRYIPKNQLKERLAHALRDAVSLLEIQNTASYIISGQSRLERIPLKKILYIEKDGKTWFSTPPWPNTLKITRQTIRQCKLGASGKPSQKFLRNCTQRNSILLSGDIS